MTDYLSMDVRLRCPVRSGGSVPSHRMHASSALEGISVIPELPSKYIALPCLALACLASQYHSHALMLGLAAAQLCNLTSALDVCT
jgi:hypothetical protein